MTHIERVRRIIKLKEADKVPRGEFDIALPLAKKLLKIGDDGVDPFLVKKMALELLDADVLAVSPRGPSPSSFVSKAGRLGFSFPHPKSYDFSEIKKWASANRFFVFALINGPFQTICSLLGFQEYMVRAAADCQEMKILSDRAGEFQLKLAQICIKAGVQGVIIADDIAHNGGTFISPDILRTSIVPVWRKMVLAIHDAETFVFFHSDGYLYDMMDDIVDAGFDGLHSIQPSAGMDLSKVKSQYGDRLCLMGNIDLSLLAEGSEEEIGEAVRKTIECAKAGGGYIFGTSSGILDETLPPGNVLSMFKWANKYGYY